MKESTIHLVLRLRGGDSPCKNTLKRSAVADDGLPGLKRARTSDSDEDKAKLMEDVLDELER